MLPMCWVLRFLGSRLLQCLNRADCMMIKLCYRFIWAPFSSWGGLRCRVMFPRWFEAPECLRVSAQNGLCFELCFWIESFEVSFCRISSWGWPSQTGYRSIEYLNSAPIFSLRCRGYLWRTGTPWGLRLFGSYHNLQRALEADAVMLF